MTAFVANTNLLELIGLQSAVDSGFINDATVEATILDAKGVEVDGENWPVTMDYVVSSNGNYRLALADTLPFKANRKYVAHIHVDAGDGTIGDWKLPFWPQVRKSS